MRALLIVMLTASSLSSISEARPWRRPDTGLSCAPSTAEVCTVQSCVAYRRDIAMYAVGTATVRWNDLCHETSRWHRPRTYTVERSRSVSVETRYWYEAAEAEAECRALLARQGCN